VRNRHQEGVALITTLMILLLLSTMVVGIAWLVMGDQKLGGNNSDRQLAFYAAEAGMETMTASLENLFDSNYAPDQTAINALMNTPGPPTNIPGVLYLAPGSTTNGSGYQIAFTPSSANANLPASNFGTIPTGQYAGLVGLMTPYTLSVTAHTSNGSEVKLQREVQTVGIPVFQFGFFSQTDLSFFAGPNFNFGGRVHSNGNVWLAEGSGNTLTLAQKVTAVGQIISSNLENGFPTATAYPGTLNITNGSGVQNLLGQTPTQSVSGTTNSFGALGAYNSAFGPMANSVYNGDIAVGQTGVKTLNLAIATPAIGGQPIDMIRRPIAGEATSNAAKLAERYWSQVSLRVLLSDYDSNGQCANTEISSTSAVVLPGISPNVTTPGPTPVDLATLAWDSNATAGTNGPPYTAAPAGLTSSKVGISIFPLPVSNAQSATAYSTADGYWVKQYFPTITGCLKIEYQSNTSPGTWVDVTWEILNLGYTGRNINPQVGAHGVPLYTSVTPPALPGMSGTNQANASGPTANAAVSLIGCSDPSANAVIRLARLRDNPTTAHGAGSNDNNWCGSNPSTNVWSGLTSHPTVCATAGDSFNCPSTHGTDYWPNVIFDTREALLRDTALSPAVLPVAGAMSYVELDVTNLAKWFSGTIGASGTSVLNTTGYSVYFSDRRGNLPDPAPPASVGATSARTGGYGYEDIVNSVNGVSTANGCPNGTADQGEDLEGDYNSSGVDSSVILRTYGNTLSTLPTNLWPISVNGSVVGTQLGGVSALIGSVLQNNPSCTTNGTQWPYAAAFDGLDLRENPPLFFRRALKIVNGSTINIGTCNSVPCGLALIAENPVYLQGDYNNPGLNTSFSGAGVGASVIADAVTLLSDNWNDTNSFAWPYTLGDRNATTTTYRVAVAAGKGVPFINPVGYYQDFGTDGGAHNFLRYIENWGGQTLYYEGSIVSMFYNHQAEGTYKCCNTVYSPPSRGYQFDTNFLTPSLLPPLTPMLRLVNTIGFTQMILPTQ
jgi:PilX N-terminal